MGPARSRSIFGERPGTMIGCRRWNAAPMSIRNPAEPFQPASAASIGASGPYPKELASTGRLRDGTEIEVRPIHPEDEKLLHDLAAQYDARSSAAALLRPDAWPIACARGSPDEDRL